MSEVPILLSGMMGVGKSTIGAQLADRFGCPFVDLDDVIAARAGQSIAAIFAQQGEDAFRAMEAAELRELLASSSRCVVALGGGCLVDDPLRNEALERAVVVTLRASVATLASRLAGQHVVRPKLEGAHLSERLTELLCLRQHSYASSPIQVDTDRKNETEVVDELEKRTAAAAQLFAGASARRRLVINTEQSASTIYVGRDILQHIPHALSAKGIHPGPVFMVIDQGAAVCGQRARQSLSDAGYQVTSFSFPGGERHKTPALLADVWSSAASARMARDRPFISVGGGVCGDLTGFAAATYQRGVPFFQIPTTLLAMVDASVGGKTAVDLPEGKNLAGAFHQPQTVLLDRQTLITLPQATRRQGFAEMVKHALLEGEQAFAELEACMQQPFDRALDDDGWLTDELLRRTLSTKARIVSADFREGGVRRVLNLGHTFAHALELCADFKVSHGDAVAVGLCTALRYRAKEDVTLDLLPRLIGLLRWAGLPTRVDETTAGKALSPKQLTDAMAGDKKVKDGRLHLVLLDAVGHPVVEPVHDASRLERAWSQSMTTAEGERS